MKISWLGHACFKIEKDGYAIVIDPYEPNSVPGLGPVKEKANMVLCSHQHFDHNYADGVEIVPDLLGTDVKVTKMETFHDDAQGTKRGPNTMFLIEIGGEKVAHLGDIGCELTEEQVAMLRGVDALMVPVGGFFTIDAAQAGKLVEKVQPKIAIPMHFRDDEAGFGYDKIGTAAPFIEGKDKVAVYGTEVYTEGVDAKIVVLHPKNLK